MAHLAPSVSGAIRTFSFWIANGTVGLPLLEGIDYSAIFREPSALALRQNVVPTLRDMQFKGTFPHFKRPRESQMDLLAFQFNRWGGSFVIEVAWCDPKGWLKRTGELVEPNEVRVSHINPKQRLRLGSNPPKQADYCFASNRNQTVSMPMLRLKP